MYTHNFTVAANKKYHSASHVREWKEFFSMLSQKRKPATMTTIFEMDIVHIIRWLCGIFIHKDNFFLFFFVKFFWNANHVGKLLTEHAVQRCFILLFYFFFRYLYYVFMYRQRIACVHMRDLTHKNKQEK